MNKSQCEQSYIYKLKNSIIFVRFIFGLCEFFLRLSFGRFNFLSCCKFVFYGLFLPYKMSAINYYQIIFTLQSVRLPPNTFIIYTFRHRKIDHATDKWVFIRILSVKRNHYLIKTTLPHRVAFFELFFNFRLII